MLKSLSKFFNNEIGQINKIELYNLKSIIYPYIVSVNGLFLPFKDLILDFKNDPNIAKLKIAF